MDIQTKACNAVLDALKSDKGKRKKADHWKKYACKALGIKKMGNARWNLLLEHGEKLGVFHRDDKALASKTILVAGSKKQTSIMDLNIEVELLNNALGESKVLGLNEAYQKDTKKQSKSQTPSQTKEVVPETVREPKRDKKGFYPDDYVSGSGLVKINVTQPKNIKGSVISKETEIPRKGDVFWAKCADQSVKQVEITEVHVSVYAVPLSNKEGYWTCLLPEDLHNTKKQAKVCPEGEETREYWSINAMDKENFALFKEYEDNRDQFLKWKKEKNLDSTPPVKNVEQDNVSDNFDDFLENL
jgi:hypothetical protein